MNDRGDHVQGTYFRGIGFDGQIRAIAADTRLIVEYARERHGLTPTAAAALGRTLTAGTLMGVMLKDRQHLSIRVNGNGPIGQIVVEANAMGEVRGYVDEPTLHLPLNENGKLDVSGAVGKEGFIHVTKDIGMREPYRGGVPIISGELGEDFTYYFAQSEQTPSAVSLGVLVNEAEHPAIIAAGGFIIQVMPGTAEHVVETIERNISQTPPVTQMLTDGLGLAEILANVLGTVTRLEEGNLFYKCNCSKERVEKALISVSKKELKEILDEDGQAELTCHFCNGKYLFDRDDLLRLIAQ
jgi:molecular chaperone Hsp33